MRHVDVGRDVALIAALERELVRTTDARADEGEPGVLVVRRDSAAA